MKNDSPKKRKTLPPLTMINPNAAGIDIGSAEIYVCVPADRDEDFVRRFESFTSDLNRIADWLKVCFINTVAIESTSVYWIPLYEILIERGFDVRLINPRQLKRPKKTDVSDCQWLQQMHSYGLFSSSFRPADQYCVLRSIIRHRASLISCRSMHIQHMQKALHQMNIQLDNVIADITGQTGMLIIRAIVSGNRDAATLASFRNSRCKSSEETIQKSLEGNYREEHLFALKQSLECFDFYTRQLMECDLELEKKYIQMAAHAPEQTLPQSFKKATRDKNGPEYDLQTYLFRSCGIDLTQVPAIGSLTAQTILVELGDDLTNFPTVKHFVSWLSLCPNNRISGGKVQSRHIRPVQNKVAQALRMAASSLANAKSSWGNYYRKMRGIHGPAKANVICAHKLARVIYFMLTRKQQFQHSLLEIQLQKDRNRCIASLMTKARRYGFLLVPTSPTSVS